jgi:DNA-binding CsgD family transcriptional regulator
MARIKYKEAAGLEVKRGRPLISQKPSKPELRRLYVRESKSIRDIARILGCSKDMIYRALQEYNIERRPRIKGSALWKHETSILHEGIKEKGIRGFAKELGIDESTLRYHLKRRNDE